MNSFFKTDSKLDNSDIIELSEDIDRTSCPRQNSYTNRELINQLSIDKIDASSQTKHDDEISESHHSCKLMPCWFTNPTRKNLISGSVLVSTFILILAPIAMKYYNQNKLRELDTMFLCWSHPHS